MGEACNLLSEKLTFRRHCHGISDSLSCHRCAGTFSDLGLDTSAACGRRLHLMRTFGERCGLAQTQGSNETAAPAFTQQIDPAFRGVWPLNVEKSDFGGRPKPKMEQLNWTERG